MATTIHPTAIVEKGAELGSDVEVGAYAYVGSNVQLSDECLLHHHPRRAVAIGEVHQRRSE